MNKLISAEQAAKLVHSEETVGISGFAFGFGFPEAVCAALDTRFCEERKPERLTLIFGSGCGDGGESPFGLAHFAHTGMVRRVIAGHVGLTGALSDMINRNEIEAYNFPQGVICHLFREIAGGRSGVITHVGLDTFVDPKFEGGRLNDCTTEDLVQHITVQGQDMLFYPALPIQVALIRGTVADEDGNLTVEREGVLLEVLHLAQAAKNSGGIVIAQVESVASRGSLDPRRVEVPGILVDYLVCAPPEHHKMNVSTLYDPALTGELRRPFNQLPSMKMGVRKVIARRCAQELNKGDVVNLGIGMPEGVAAVAFENGAADAVTLTVEAGAIGGIPGMGHNLGASVNLSAMIGQPNIFDLYDGGGLDIAILGLAQVDGAGNVNVSKFNGRTVGCGGFINISQNARRVVFCGTFNAGGTQAHVERGMLKIDREGRVPKFLPSVEQITFSGPHAIDRRQEVLYVTERAVFRLTHRGVELIEVAPGIDIDRDIIDRMGFVPVIQTDLQQMPASCFVDDP